MASSDNSIPMDTPWAFRPSFSDAWISDIYTGGEAGTLAEALHMSFAAEPSSDGGGALSPAGDSPFFNPDKAPTASDSSNNEVSAAVSKPRRSVAPIGGRVTKRKPRPSKRVNTTFIAADVANFRRMVQQVTGVRFGGVPALKPEPHRAMIGAGGFPTFDASAFFMDGSASTAAAQAPAAGEGIEFESYYSFPTLESYAIN